MAQPERLMAETQEAVAGAQPLVQAPLGEQSPQKPWHISPEYDPKRAKEYEVKEEGNYNVFTDPVTGKEVVRVLKIAGGTEEQRGPEGRRGVEWETSPERGREIVKEIIRLETTLPYTERYSVTRGLLSTIGKPEIYNERSGTYLDQLYKDLQDYTRALRRIRNDRNIKDPWNPINIYRKITEALRRRAAGEPPEVAQQVGTGQVRERGERPPVLPTESLNALFEKYIGANVDAVEGDLATYFQEARALGLLDRADAIFALTYRQIKQGNIPADQVEEMLEKNTELARRAIDGAFRARRTNPAVANLQGIAEAYTRRTADIFQLILIDEAYNPIEGEFRFDLGLDEADDTENYWRPGHWPKTYEIIAKTTREFRRAVDSFLGMVTSGRLGKSPDQLYEHFNNFTERLVQTAHTENIDKQSSIQLKQELEGHGFVFGGDYSFESYNMKSANQFLMAMALHEGPERYVAVARSGNGGVAPNLWKFDYDPRVTLMHNPGGSRSQLLSDSVTRHYLHTEIRNILIEEGMGVVLKNYRPGGQYLVDDPEFAELSGIFTRIQSGLNSGRRLDEFSEEDQRLYITALPVLRTEVELKANMERIGIHQPVEEFKGLYEGFDNGGAHIANFRVFGNIDQNQLPIGLRRSVIIGKVQIMLQGNEGKDKEQLLEVIDNFIDEGQLNARDKRLWVEAYDQSKANFDTAFQMVGAMGEKARRGGGVFFIDRKDEQRRRFVDNMPVYLGEMFIQYAENRAKIQFANDPAITRTEAVARARTLAIQEIHTNGFEAKLSFPKLLFNTDENSPNFGDVIGIDTTQTEITETIDFETATDPENPLNKWTSHTYLSYQSENRHQVTNPDVLKAAKRRRIRLLRPDLMTGSDEDQYENLADIRLIMDPTLNRVANLQDTDMPEGMSSQQAEIIFSDAAVEASNMSHWRISRELNAAFMPNDGNSFRMRTGYNLEDYSGIARFIIRMRQFVASNPKRFARRYAAEIANLPVNVSSMPDQWGQTGVLGAIEMFADPIGKMSEQKEASQFAITKWVEQMRIGNMLFDALVGHVDSERGFSTEGLFEKPTNNAEKVAQIQAILADLIAGKLEAEVKFMDLVLESFDRLWIVLKLVRTIESDTRNAQGALDLEKKDLFKDGKVDADLLNALARDSNTGSSRHTEEQFFYAYIKWLTSEEQWAGEGAYPLERQFYLKLLEKSPLDPLYTKDKQRCMTRAQWLFRKMVR